MPAIVKHWDVFEAPEPLKPVLLHTLHLHNHPLSKADRRLHVVCHGIPNDKKLKEGDQHMLSGGITSSYCLRFYPWVALATNYH